MFHIDSRCLHGQVVAGWGFREGIKRFLLANDEVAADEWERNQYLSTPGSEYETFVLSIADSIARLKSWVEEARQGVEAPEYEDEKRLEAKTMLVVSAPCDAERIIQGMQGAARPGVVTIGNLDPGPDKRQLAPAVFVAPDDQPPLEAIIRLGISVVIKPLPTSPPIPVTLDDLGPPRNPPPKPPSRPKGQEP